MAKARSTNNRESRYVQGGVTQQYRDRLGWWERRYFPPSDTDSTITLTQRYNKRPDLLAFDLYGRATYMWVVLQYNNITDINEQFVEGSEIIVPSRQRVVTEFLTRTS